MAGFAFGSLDLLTDPYLLLSDGMDLGNPATVTSAIAGLLLDGEVVSGDRSSNRMIQFRVQIQGATAAALAAAEAALAVEVNQTRNTITWTPGSGTPVVFDTFRGQLVAIFDPILDLSQTRAYMITVPALPFSRSPDKVTLASVTTAPTLIDEMDDITGVTANGSTVGVSSDTTSFTHGTASIRFDYQQATVFTPSTAYISLARAITSLNLTGITQLQVSTYGFPYSNGNPRLVLSSAGATSTYVGGFNSPNGSGWREVTFQAVAIATTGGGVNLAAVTSWTVQAALYLTTTAPPPNTLRIDYLRAYVGPYSNINAKGSGVITFPGFVGSARAPLDLAVDCGAAVTSLLVATCPNRPDAFSPLINATTTADATALSGFYNPSTATYLLPSFAYRGQFAIFVRAKQLTTAATNVTVTVQLAQPPMSTRVTVATKILPSVPITYAIYPLAVVTLPFPDVDALNTAQHTTLGFGGGNVVIDQVYILPLDGDIIRYAPAAAVPVAPRYFFIESPTPAAPNGSFVAGALTNRTDALAIQKDVLSGSTFRASPGSLKMLFVAEGGTSSATVTASYYPRWFASRGI